MKIVHLVMVGPYTEGFTYQENLIPKYHKILGHDVTIITNNWIWNNQGNLEAVEPGTYNDNGVKVIRIPTNKGNCYSRFKKYPLLMEKMIEEKPEILFIHDCQFLDLRTVVKYLKKYRCQRVFLDNHSDFGNSARNWLSLNILHKIIWKRGVNKIEPYVDKFYGVMPARVDFLKDVYGLPENKCELLLMGADDQYSNASKVSEYRTEMRKELGFADDDFVIVTGGKIDTAKYQVLDLMDAVAEINDSKLKLVVFGSIDKAIKNKFDSKLNNSIRYVGWVDNVGSYKYFAAGDIVCFPGRHSVYWEQVGGMGIPMIVKYQKGCTHIDGGGNIKFLQESNKDEIIAVIKSILNNPDEYTKMKEIAESGIDKFSYMQIAKRCIMI